jgi:DNA-binding transcriptional ArsR family regulator
MTEHRENGLSQDALFSLLSNPRRRFILKHLNGIEGSVKLQELAAEVAAWENETDPEALTDKQRKRLYVSLYQTHIPKLEEAGIVEYDGDTGDIRLTDRGSDLNRYLDGDAAEAGDDRRWGRYYLAVALGSAAAYAAVAIGGAADQAGLVVIGVGWLLIAGIAAYHYIETEGEM